MNINIEKTAANLIEDNTNHVMVFSEFSHEVFKSGTEGIILKFQVVEGEADGKTVKMNLWPYSSEGGAKFAQIRIAQIAKASGMKGDLNGEDYDELLNQLVNKVVGAHIIIKNDDFGAKNEISYFMEKDKVKKADAPKAPPKPIAKPQAAPGVDAFEDDLI